MTYVGDHDVSSRLQLNMQLRKKIFLYQMDGIYFLVKNSVCTLAKLKER